MVCVTMIVFCHRIVDLADPFLLYRFNSNTEKCTYIARVKR